MDRELSNFSLKATIAAAIGGFAVTLLLLLWHGIDVLLLVFAGILLSILLRGIGDWISRKTGLSGRWSLSLVLLVGLVGSGLGVWLLGASIADQFSELSERLPRAAEEVRSRLEGQKWSKEFLQRLPAPSEFLSGGAVRRVAGAASGALGAIGGAVVVLFIGIFVAFEPQVYLRGLLCLVPSRGRPRAEETIRAIGDTLRGWLIGKAFSMAAVGFLTVIGLWAIGVPLAIPLGIIAALLSFIPNIGPVLSLIPAMLIAIPEGPMKTLYVIALFTAIQAIESYLLTPMVQRNLISMPPALIISAQLLLGALVGFLGLLVATPLTAAAIVLVKKLYVEDILGKQEEAQPGGAGG